MAPTNPLVNISLRSPTGILKDVVRKDLNNLELAIGTASSHRSIQPEIHHINERKPGKHTDRYHHKPSGVNEPSLIPLLQSSKKKLQPPIDEFDECDNARPTDATPCLGIDKRLLEPADKTDVHHEGDTEDEDSHHHHERHHQRHDDEETTDDSSKSQKTCTHEALMGNAIPDMNTYQQKKNLAQGMMDLALLSANANQLRYVIESAASHPYYYPSLIFISFSIVLQIAVGIGLTMNVKYEKDIHKADKINNMTVLGVFIITVVNVFTTSFSVATPTTIVPGGTHVAAIQQSG